MVPDVCGYFYGAPHAPALWREVPWAAWLELQCAGQRLARVYAGHNGPLVWALVRDAVLAFVFLRLIAAAAWSVYAHGPVELARRGLRSGAKRGARIVMLLPPVKRKVDAELAKTLTHIEDVVIQNDAALLQFATLPETGLPIDDVERELLTSKKLKHNDWEAGRVSGAVYHGGPELLKLQLEAYHQYSIANQLHPDVFPGIRKMEAECVAMVLRMFNAPASGCGCTTLGGTESLLLAGLAARQFGRKRGIRHPEVIAPVTVHAGIEKACFYFGMTLHKVPLDASYKVDVARVKRLINSNTVLLVGLAPNYPHGIIDDIEALSKLAVRYKIPLHVDACLGLFVVAFLEQAAVHESLPLFDFRLPGVTSISCDTHKYGFAPKGSSIVMYRTPELRKCQYYVLSSWTGGMYGSPTLAGSRPGALMAGCWATLVHIGEAGYTQLARDIVLATMRFKTALRTHPLLAQHLEVLGEPLVTVVAFRAKSSVGIYALGDAMSAKGWHMAALQRPAALHFAFTRLSVPVVDELVADLVEAVEAEAALGAGKQSDTAAMYGVAGSVSTKGVADRLIVGFLDAMYKLG